MSRRLAFLILFAAVPVCSLAQLKVHLDFGSPGPREMWVGAQAPKAPPTTVFKTDAAKYDLSLPGFGTGDKLFVWDHTTGNIAAKPIAEASNGWTVKPEEYKWIGLVTIQVEHKGQPVAAAGVTLKDKGRELTQQLSPSANGAATFFAVEPGDIKVSVSYSSKGKTADPLKQGYELALKREKPDPVFVVAIADEVETVAPSSSENRPASQTQPGAANDAKPPSSTGEPKESNPPNAFGTIFVILIVLALAGAGGYFALQYMKNNSQQVQDKLEQLGVQVPKPVDDQPLPVANVPAPKAPEPPQKIMLDNASPDPIGVAGPSTAVAPVATGQPRLIMQNGDEFPIPDGETTVGREVGLGLSLVGEGTVSRSHAVLVRSGDSVTVRDLGSTNGTFVNGMKVADGAPLRPGDSVQFGSVQFRFEG